MSINFANFAHFHLRRDFADELCFYETVRTPMTRAEYEEIGRRMANNGQRLVSSYEEYCDQKRHHTPKLNIFGIYAIREAASNALHPIITDYWNRVYMDYDGLFQDVVEGAKLACGMSRKDPCPIIALEHAPEHKGKRFPTHFVRHDSTAGVATVLPWGLYEEALDPCWEQSHHYKS